jgi:hypothetical protein
VAFDWRGVLRFSRRTLFETRNTNRRLTPKRLAWILFVYSAYPLVELATWSGLALDELIYPGYRQQEVWEPIFIVGNPRSGTTFLHRLLARDEWNFACMHTWEILFAPSIVARRVIKGLGAVDDWLGNPFLKTLTTLEEHWRKRNVMHWQAMCTPEEDEALMVHTGSSVLLPSFGAMLDDARAHIYYDRQIPRAKRMRETAFYRRCLQRYLYSDGRHPEVDQRHYLAKNPAFTFRIDTLLEQFPDARFVYIMRNPLDMIPSFVSITKFTWDLLGDPVEYESLHRYAIELAREGYRYPLDRLRYLGRERYAVVRFDDLVRDPSKTVNGIYDRLGLEMSPDYADILDEEAEFARRYRSRHKYSLEGLGLSRERILNECAEMFDRLGFDRREPDQGRA